MKEIEELRRAIQGDVDVLYHRLRMQPAKPCEDAGEPDTAVPAHDPLVRDRIEPRASERAPHQGVLRADVLRAPEPVGVPAPEVVARGEPVLGALADRAVVDALVR